MDCRQVEELLPGHALNALSDDESAQVEAHLDSCLWCPALFREHLAVAGLLANAAEQMQPPEKLRTSILKGVGPRSQRAPRFSLSLPPIGRALLGAAAGVAVLLLVVVAAMGVVMSSRIGDLKDENSELSTQLAQLGTRMTDEMSDLRDGNVALARQVSHAAEEDEKLMDMFLEQRSMNYVLASPEKQVVSSLQGPRDVPQAHGTLLIASEDGTGLLVAQGLKPLSNDDSYYVWLREDGEPVIVGRLKVDERGWGILSLWPDRPITLYQQVWVTAETKATDDQTTSKPVLWGTISSR